MLNQTAIGNQTVETPTADKKRRSPTEDADCRQKTPAADRKRRSPTKNAGHRQKTPVAEKKRSNVEETRTDKETDKRAKRAEIA